MLQGLSACNGDASSEDGSLRKTCYINNPVVQQKASSSLEQAPLDACKNVSHVMMESRPTARVLFCAGVSCCSKAAPI